MARTARTPRYVRACGGKLAIEVTKTSVLSIPKLAVGALQGLKDRGEALASAIPKRAVPRNLEQFWFG